MLAIIYIVRGVFTRSLTKETADSLARMTYGVVCFATLFSFVGTVLGGIWADQSWGRFLGLGSEGKRRCPDRALVRDHSARALGRVHSSARADDHGDLRQRGHEFLLVRREHARRRSAFLRLHAKSISLAVSDSSLSQLALMAVAAMPLERWRSFRTSAAAPRRTTIKLKFTPPELAVETTPE